MCKHRFENLQCIMIEGNEKKYPRLVKVCKRCGVAIHVPIYTKKELGFIENE